MLLTRNGLTFSVDDAEVSRLVLERFNGIEARLVSATHLPPRIGEVWRGQGGVYAGVMRGRDGGADYHLIAGPEHDDDIAWQPAMDWAPTVKVDGHADLVLPYLPELSVLRGNVPELFKRAYWSCETHAAHSCFAYSQDFKGGYQGCLTKDIRVRARLVRR